LPTDPGNNVEEQFAWHRALNFYDALPAKNKVSAHYNNMSALRRNDPVGFTNGLCTGSRYISCPF
jgi:hypothetical protein